MQEPSSYRGHKEYCFFNGRLGDKKIFLYWEDFELCRRLKIKKISIIKSFNSTAIHLERRSVKSSYFNKFIMTVHNDKSAYIYFKVKKNNPIFIKRIFLYIFRFASYLLIFNLKKSLKNLNKKCVIVLNRSKIWGFCQLYELVSVL